ncbi:4-hydroxythreonine-4-phosphate dehydrogenase PdxA [Candidatus Pelagibacter sp.]|nr:4-hydroxythreonine-4-phosphate dehydrogenase PdxA [Candidatus Pelagibacter sp.]
MNNKPLIIVAGEPYSIFSEIFLKSIKDRLYKKPIILIVSKNLFVKQMKKLDFKLEINLINKNDFNLNKLSKKKINIINVDFKFKKTFDKISSKSNHYINECFEVALKLLKKNIFAGLINGPISKKSFLGKKFLGVTEYLAQKTNKDNKVAMLIYNKKFSVSPTTTHLPLKLVNKSLSKNKIINQIKIIRNFYKFRLNKEPRFAVTGLNPHCESNYQSSEEKKIIIPAINYLIKKKYKIKGPFPADTIFMREKLKNYDVVIGMYHDQVLSPAKTILGFEAINITLGLPFVRISPDHGPNTEMLGKNISNPKSLIEAIKFFNK